MSDIPRVWWLPLPEVLVQQDDGNRLWVVDLSHQVRFRDDKMPSKAVPLVPQASRDELREAVVRAIHSVLWTFLNDDGEDTEAAADEVLDVLAERGLVASPETGEGGHDDKS